MASKDTTYDTSQSGAGAPDKCEDPFRRGTIPEQKDGPITGAQEKGYSQKKAMAAGMVPAE